MKLTLGPVLYLWEPAAWRDFYYRMADEADVDTVILGEVVCSKRQHFHEKLLPEAIARLRAAGKTAQLSSLALVTLARELNATRHLALDADVAIEANDISAHYALSGKPHTIGPFVNVYNAATASLLTSRGATSICLPPELPLTSIASIARHAVGTSLEVFAFGRIPLAISARCAHARLKGRTKDNCQFVCGDEADGLLVETLDGQPFLALNGVQTMSSSCQSLLGEIQELDQAGVRSLRLSPQVCDMAAVASIFRSVTNGTIDAATGHARLAAACPDVEFANGFAHGVPGHALIGARQQLPN